MLSAPSLLSATLRVNELQADSSPEFLSALLSASPLLEGSKGKIKIRSLSVTRT